MTKYQRSENFRRLVSVLREQKRVLSTAGVERSLIDLFADAITFIEKHTEDEIRSSGKHRRASPEISDSLKQSIQSMPLKDIELLVNKDDTSRKVLEAVAISRFKVPKGSMRSFPSVDILRSKINSRIENERTHRTIEQLARKGKQGN